MDHKVKINSLNGVSGYVILEDKGDINRRKILKIIDDHDFKQNKTYIESFDFFIYLCSLIKQMSIKINGKKIKSVEELGHYQALFDVGRIVVCFYSKGIETKIGFCYVLKEASIFMLKLTALCVVTIFVFAYVFSALKLMGLI